MKATFKKEITAGKIDKKQVILSLAAGNPKANIGKKYTSGIATILK